MSPVWKESPGVFLNVLSMMSGVLVNVLEPGFEAPCSGAVAGNSIVEEVWKVTKLNPKNVELNEKAKKLWVEMTETTFQAWKDKDEKIPGNTIPGIYGENIQEKVVKNFYIQLGKDFFFKK